jgi:hypothetical protein
VDRPPTRFAWNDDVSLAYQIIGDGPVDLLYLQGYASQVDLNWEPPYPRPHRRSSCQSQNE